MHRTGQSRLDSSLLRSRTDDLYVDLTLTPSLLRTRPSAVEQGTKARLPLSMHVFRSKLSSVSDFPNRTTSRPRFAGSVFFHSHGFLSSFLKSDLLQGISARVGVQEGRFAGVLTGDMVLCPPCRMSSAVDMGT